MRNYKEYARRHAEEAAKKEKYQTIIINIDSLSANMNITIEQSCKLLNETIESYYKMKQFLANPAK